MKHTLRFLTSLLPHGASERIAIFVLVLSIFSAYPSFGFEFVGRNISIELTIIAIAIGALYFCLKSPLEIIKLSITNPWRFLTAWLVFGSIVALILADSPIIIGIYACYSAAVYVLVLGLAHSVSTSQLRVHWFFRVWVSLAVGLSFCALFQYIIAIISPSTPFIREAYSIGVFSFPRPHGFALEPLYFANWLLAPLIYSVWYGRASNLYRHTASFILLAVILTLSRGAYIAFGVSLVGFMCVWRRTFLSTVRLLFTISVPPIIVAIALVGISSEYHQKDHDSFKGIVRFLDHASLGVFNKEGATNTEPTTLTNDSQDSTEPERESFVNVTGVDTEGVVEASTLGRIEVVDKALTIYKESPQNMIIGVGKNRTGEELHEREPEIYRSDQVTNNQLVDILVETGVVGLALMVIFITFTILSATSWLDRILIVSISAQYLFFSNYVILPLWFVLALTIGATSKRGDSKKHV